MANSQIYMNEISDLIQKKETFELCVLKKSRIEINLNNDKIIGFLEICELNRFAIKLISSNNVEFKNDSYKATVYTDAKLFGLVFNFLKKDGELFWFSYPDKLFSINRRETFRFKIPTGYQVDVGFIINNSNFEGSVLDISLEGAGILISLDKKDKFKVGDLISNIHIKLENKEIYAFGEIRSITEYATNQKKGIKLGIKFTKIQNQYQTCIMNYMNRHLSHYSKKLA